MKRQIENIILCLFLLFVGGIYSAVAQNEKRPNIIFIVTDDQHRDQFNFIKEGLDAEGKPTNLSPNIDQLAAEGVIFDNSQKIRQKNSLNI